MRSKLILFPIFALAFILRFWQLGLNPPSLDWDEASLGYNAYSILKTGKDEYGNFLPLSIRSFNDYKPPLYTYLTIVPVTVFGLTEFSTRFISALFGTLAVIVSYFLIKELFSGKSSIFYLLPSFFFAVSPWHIQFSRIAFEANLALLFVISGIFFFLKGLKQGKYLILSSIAFGLSIYAYHSPRLVVPLLIFGFLIIFRKEIKGKFLWFLSAGIIFAGLTFPIIWQFNSSTGMRLGSVTVLNPNERLGPSIKAIEADKKNGDFIGELMHNRRIVFGREILAGYLDHFNFDFLFLTGDAPGRHHAVGMGMLYVWDLFFIVLGIFYLVGNRNKYINAMFWWFIVAPVASSITTGTPHAVRALLYLPLYQIFASVGFVELLRRFNKLTVKVRHTGLIIIFFLFILNFYYYLHMYWIHTPQEYSRWWQYGYKEVVEEAQKWEDKIDKIIVTYHYDQPYIYFLFYNRLDPKWYQRNWGSGEIKRAERNFGKYEFRNINWEKDSKLTNTLFIVSANEIPEDASGIVKTVYFLDGSVAFRVVAR